MRRFLVVLSVGFLVVVAACSAEDSESADGEAQWLAVVDAESGSAADGVLTLSPVDGVLVFTDSPAREATTTDEETLVSRLGEETPNALVRWSGSGAREMAVVSLSSPVVDDDGLSFSYELIEDDDSSTVLSDELSASMSEVVLYIDPIRNPGPWTGT